MKHLLSPSTDLQPLSSCALKTCSCMLAESSFVDELLAGRRRAIARRACSSTVISLPLAVEEVAYQGSARSSGGTNPPPCRHRGFGLADLGKRKIRRVRAVPSDGIGLLKPDSELAGERSHWRQPSPQWARSARQASIRLQAACQTLIQRRLRQSAPSIPPEPPQVMSLFGIRLR